jgi:hypothetical protein
MSVKKQKMTDEERYEFSQYLHNKKSSGLRGVGRKGDFSFKELDDLAGEFLGEGR